MAQTTPHLLLNTSWTLHRLSPLHHGKEFQTLVNNPTALKTYASRLRDQLTGSATVETAPTADDDTLSRSGALLTCTWETLTSLSFTEEREPEPELELELELERSEKQKHAPSRRRADKENENHNYPGILVMLQYENITYKAALLGPDDQSQSQDHNNEQKPRRDQRKGSTYLPLLLTRFPAPLRQTFIGFLAANFDTYAAPLRLPSQVMCAGLETYISALTAPSSGPEDSRDDERGDNGIVLEDVVKELQLTIAFSPSIAPELRSLNVTIPRGYFADFVRVGGDSGGERGNGGLLSGLSDYLERHLAMKLDLNADSKSRSPASQHARISKIACGGFLLTGEGRLKLVSLQKSSGGDGGDTPSRRDRGMLRANEALLLTVIRRAVASDGQGT